MGPTAKLTLQVTELKSETALTLALPASSSSSLSEELKTIILGNRDEEMYEEVTGFSAGTASFLSEDWFSPMGTTSVPTQNHNPGFPQNVGLPMENLAFPSQQALPNIAASAFTGANYPYGDNIVSTHMVEEANHYYDSNQLALPIDPFKWDTNMNYHRQNHHQHQDQPLHYHLHNLNLLYSLPISASTSSHVSSSFSFGNPTAQKTVEQLHIFPSGHGGLADGSHPTLGPENTYISSVLFHSLPSRNDFLLFGGDGDKEGSGIVSYLDADSGRDFGDDNNNNNGVLKFTQDLAAIGRNGGEGRGGKRVKQVTTEKKRRVDFTSKFDALRELIPKPIKNDRASLLCGAIEYIQEIRRSVNDLTLLANKKRCGKEKIKRHKVDEEDEEEEEEEQALGDLERCNLKALSESDHQLEPHHRCMIRSSWLKKKSEDTEVDVRISDDEVTIKLVQRKNINCLLYASKVLDELELDLQHVAGGHIGDFCSFLFNSKICEGSSACASAIANKLVEVLEAA